MRNKLNISTSWGTAEELVSGISMQTFATDVVLSSLHTYTGMSQDQLSEVMPRYQGW